MLQRHINGKLDTKLSLTPATVTYTTQETVETKKTRSNNCTFPCLPNHGDMTYRQHIN